MAVSSSPPAAPYRRLGWRYSLRALLIIVTLACAGLWFWFRVPFTTEIHYPFGGKEIQRFRRTLIGKPIRHGMTEEFDKEGHRVLEEHWREGQRHGPWIRWHAGKVSLRGEYLNGEKQGLWEQFYDSTARLTRFDQGRPHGDMQILREGKVTRTIRFDHGEVIQIDGRKVDDSLGRTWRLGLIEDERITNALLRPAVLDFKETPLSTVVNYVRDHLGIQVVLSRKCQADLPITYKAHDTTGGAMLVLVGEPHGVAPTYRFGVIWITTKDDAANWVDRTGISTLVVNAPGDASLADQQKVRAALEKPASLDLIDVPGGQIAGYLSDTYGIRFACGESTQNVALTSNLSGISLKNALGALCEQHDLRIRWTEGTTLMIERQEADQPRPRQ